MHMVLEELSHQHMLRLQHNGDPSNNQHLWMKDQAKDYQYRWRKGQVRVLRLVEHHWTRQRELKVNHFILHEATD